MPGQAIITGIEIAAVTASAISGVVLASRKKFDLVGVFSIAFLVAFGGGTIRDLCLDRQPLFWIASAEYVWIVLGISLLGAMAPRILAKSEPWMRIPDALGLALFTITGASYALAAGTPAVVAVIMGTVTGTFGGVIGQTICNEIPSLFRRNHLYATCAALGAWVYILLRPLPIDPLIPAVASFLMTFLSRMAALRWGWRLPVVGGK